MENSAHNMPDRPFSDGNYKDYKRNLDEINIFYDKLLVGLLIKIFV